MKEYESPKCTVLRLTSEDILTSSGGEEEKNEPYETNINKQTLPDGIVDLG